MIYHARKKPVQLSIVREPKWRPKFRRPAAGKQPAGIARQTIKPYAPKLGWWVSAQEAVARWQHHLPELILKLRDLGYVCRKCDRLLASGARCPAHPLLRPHSNWEPVSRWGSPPPEYVPSSMR